MLSNFKDTAGLLNRLLMSQPAPAVVSKAPADKMQVYRDLLSQLKQIKVSNVNPLRKANHILQ